MKLLGVTAESGSTCFVLSRAQVWYLAIPVRTGHPMGLQMLLDINSHKLQTAWQMVRNDGSCSQARATGYLLIPELKDLGSGDMVLYLTRYKCISFELF